MAGKPDRTDKPNAPAFKVVSTNRRARHEYEILETFECGLALQGHEVKSIREGGVNLAESYARVNDGELFLVNCHIPEYRAGGWTNHDPRRPRKLLLHRKEIDKMVGKIELKGLTLIPLRLYFNSRGFAKVEIAPSPGPLQRIHSRLPHPRGFVETDLEFTGQACRGKIVLPDGIDGVFHWQGQTVPLHPGEQKVYLK